MKQIKLGILGLSKGNGHPYSWSAIFNGYNSNYMKDCPFSAIPEYLSRQNFPHDTIKNANVTHIWTQDKKISKHVSNASNIPNIVNNYCDMIGQVDAILLARDDYENHFEMSKPFIEARLPIYIDKPISINLQSTKKIFNLEQFENQIFTCSAISYAKEFDLDEKTLTSLGKIRHIQAFVMKDWEKYSIHVIEPILKILLSNRIIDTSNKIIDSKRLSSKNQTTVLYKFDSELIVSISSLDKLKTPIKICIFGEKNFIELKFEDTFYAFKKALEDFINVVNGKTTQSNKNLIFKTIEMIEKGCAYE